MGYAIEIQWVYNDSLEGRQRYLMGQEDEQYVLLEVWDEGNVQEANSSMLRATFSHVI